jgi:hypothetical protein
VVTKSSGTFETMSNVSVCSLVLKCGTPLWSLKVSNTYRWHESFCCILISCLGMKTTKGVRFWRTKSR